MAKISPILAAAVGLALSSGVALAQADAPEVMPGCDPQGELGPSGQLQEGDKVWTRKPDVRPDDLTGSFCTSGDWVDRHEDPNDVIEVCTVPEGGLDVGPGPFGHYYDRKDPDTGEIIPADPAITIMRDENGECYIPSAAIS